MHGDGCDKLKPFGIHIHGFRDGWSGKWRFLDMLPNNQRPEPILREYLALQARRCAALGHW